MAVWSGSVSEGYEPDLLRNAMLCTVSSWITRAQVTWGLCAYGAVAAQLLFLFCALPGPPRVAAYNGFVERSQIKDWGALMAVDWCIFEIIATGARIMHGVKDDFMEQGASVLSQCEGDFHGQRPLLHEHGLIFDTAVEAAASSDAGLVLSLPSKVREAALNLCKVQAGAAGIARATACTLGALASSDELRRYQFLSMGELALEACVGPGTRNMLPVFLWSRWPLVGLLALIHRNSHGRLRSISPPFTAPVREYMNELHMFRLTSDVLYYPWVQHLAAAVPMQNLYKQFLWPKEAPPFKELFLEAVKLGERYVIPAVRGGAGFGDQWGSLCLVCKDGTQTDATGEDAVYLKTPVLHEAPALERFIDLFGETGRVRFSVVMAGGIIGWHSDDNVSENGRMILHVPLMTSDLAYTRLANLFFNMPAGRIFWLDYSYPHTVYNADPDSPRVHLVIDVKVEGNARFQKYFLQHLPPEELKDLLTTALSSGSHALKVDFSSYFSRSMAADMMLTFTHWLPGREEREHYERMFWDAFMKLTD